MSHNVEIIAIDHGWSSCKTPTQVFVTGVKEITTEPPLFNDVLEYQGRYYQIGGNRFPVLTTKVENENFYLLTMAGIGKELKRKGKRCADIIIAAGLPLTRFGEEKEDFQKYLSKKKTLSYKFEEIPYQVNIKGVKIYPQCYAAIFDKISSLEQRVIVVDIGSWTVDIMPVVGKKPDIANCVTTNEGLIRCFRSIKDQCNRQLSGEVHESDIQHIMCGGESYMDEKYVKLIQSELHAYAERIYNSLREYGYNLDTTPIYFVGGGAVAMKNFGNLKTKNIHYDTDVRANAKGFEILAKSAMKEKKGC